MSERIEDVLSEVERAYSAEARGPFAGVAPQSEPHGVRIETLGHRGVVLIAADLSDADAAHKLAEAMPGWSGPLPELGATGSHQGVTLLRLDDKRLLALLNYTETAAFTAAVAASFEGAALAEPVSDGYAMLRLHGDGARELIAKGAAVDMHPAAFSAGELRRIKLGAVDVILHFPPVASAQADSEMIELLCPRSLAISLLGWLRRAGGRGVAPNAIVAQPKT